ncbi:signal transduction histidine kinase [Bradyrhizobium sp. GM5.1]
MLLAKTLRSSTFRLALIAIAAFGLIVAAIMAYVYFGTIAYVQSRVGDAGDHSGFTAMIELAMAAVAVLMLVLAGLAAVLVTRRTVGRIEEINATSRAIMMSGLDQRIPLRGSHDEWDRVAENLNQMLDRIETLMGEVKQVSDNVAHDLRTPLTRMRGRLEKAYHASRNGEADAALIGDTIADLDAVLGMFASITRISEIETRARRSAFRTLNLAEIAGEVVELYDAAAEQVADAAQPRRRSRGGDYWRSRPAVRRYRQSRRQRDQARLQRRAGDRHLQQHRRRCDDRDRRRRPGHSGGSARSRVQTLLPARAEPLHPG